MSTCLAAKAFWILPMAISLPGICFEEKTTRSPLSSLIECVSPAIRASAARGSPCPPVAMIITLLRGMRMASRSEEHTSELQSLMRISYAVFCLKTTITTNHRHAIYLSAQTPDQLKYITTLQHTVHT